MNMATKRIAENNQSKLRHCFDRTKRFLRKARDFYVDAMVSFEGKVARTNVIVCPTIHVTHLPTDLGRPSSSALIDHENLDEFYRSISEKFSRSRSMSENYSWSNGTKKKVAGYGAMERSYSVALGKIGTIDEEEPCEFHEDVAMKSENLFSRCRSHVGARNLF